MKLKLVSWLGAVTVVLSLVAASAQATDAMLDRAALLKLADTYLAAVVAHDPGKVPFAPDAKIVENITRIKPGEGIWKTASGLVVINTGSFCRPFGALLAEVGSGGIRIRKVEFIRGEFHPGALVSEFPLS